MFFLRGGEGNRDEGIHQVIRADNKTEGTKQRLSCTCFRSVVGKKHCICLKPQLLHSTRTYKRTFFYYYYNRPAGASRACVRELACHISWSHGVCLLKFYVHKSPAELRNIGRARPRLAPKRPSVSCTRLYKWHSSCCWEHLVYLRETRAVLNNNQGTKEAAFPHRTRDLPSLDLDLYAAANYTAFSIPPPPLHNSAGSKQQTLSGRKTLRNSAVVLVVSLCCFSNTSLSV